MKSMMIKTLSTALIAGFLSCNSSYKNNDKASAEPSTTSVEVAENSESALANNNLELIQFHSTNRCMTCQKIEKLTKDVLLDYDGVPFRIINVDESDNEAIANKFEASGTALFLHNTKTEEFKNLTEFAFMTAGNEKKFYKELKAEMRKF